jgi:hypothetical protein
MPIKLRVMASARARPRLGRGRLSGDRAGHGISDNVTHYNNGTSRGAFRCYSNPSTQTTSIVANTANPLTVQPVASGLSTIFAS